MKRFPRRSDRYRPGYEHIELRDARAAVSDLHLTSSPVRPLRHGWATNTTTKAPHHPERRLLLRHLRPILSDQPACPTAGKTILKTTSLHFTRKINTFATNVAHQEIDLKNPKTNRKNAIPTRTADIDPMPFTIPGVTSPRHGSLFVVELSALGPSEQRRMAHDYFPDHDDLDRLESASICHRHPRQRSLPRRLIINKV